MIVTRLALGLGLFAGSLLVGWWMGRWRVLTEVRARTLMHITVGQISPITLCLSFWGLRLAGFHAWLLPSIGMLVSIAAALPAWWYSRAARLTRPQIGSMLTSAMFSNLGFLGAYIAFALHGEAAYSLAAIHMLYFSPSFYLVGFEIAKRFGHMTPGRAYGHQLLEESRFYPFIGLAVGIALNALHVPRPLLMKALNDVLIPLNTAAYLMAIGSQLQVEPLRPWAKPCVALSVIKFVYSPAIAWMLVWLFGLHGLPRFIVLLQSSMPVGISPLMLPTLFGVDRRLSNALWLCTTLLAIPWLIVYLMLLGPV